MSCTKYTKRTTCAKSFAVCVEYQGNLSEYTELDSDTCHDVEQVIEDITTILDGVKDQLNLEELEGGCITYPPGEKVLIDYLQAMQDFICTQNTTLTEMQEQINIMEQQIIDLQNNTCP